MAHAGPAVSRPARYAVSSQYVSRCRRATRTMRSQVSLRLATSLPYLARVVRSLRQRNDLLDVKVVLAVDLIRDKLDAADVHPVEPVEPQARGRDLTGKIPRDQQDANLRRDVYLIIRRKLEKLPDT